MACFQIHHMNKGDVVAVLFMLMGFVLTQLQPPDPFYVGLGIGTIAMACIWLLVRITRDYRKR